MSDALPNPGELLSEHTRHEIDRWVAKFPAEGRRSAVIAALRAAQHQNDARRRVAAPLYSHTSRAHDPGLDALSR